MTAALSAEGLSSLVALLRHYADQIERGTLVGGGSVCVGDSLLGSAFNSKGEIEADIVIAVQEPVQP